MGKEFYFETDDSLGRRKYAEFLKSLLENCDKYRREDSEGAYVIAIDLPWGTGKTRFAKMLRNYLEDRTRDMGDDSSPGDNVVCNTIYYNSWETDFSNDALQPLVHTIISSPEFKTDRFTSKGKKALRTFKESAVAVAKVAGYAIIHHLAGETVAKAAQAVDDTITEEEFNPLKEYKDRLKVLEEFKKSLRDVIEQTKQRKLVIIVDELDRCRPTFAIQTLELAKHLFDIEGLIFIFALDIKQLSCSVETVYGQDMDSAGYLCRFFDYIGKLPDPSRIDFIQLSFKQDENSTLSKKEWAQKAPDYISAIAMSFSLSLRDISTIIKTYIIVLDSWLHEYMTPQIHLLYIFLLTLKYKAGSLYTDFLLHKNERENDVNSLTKVRKYLPELASVEIGVLGEQLQKISYKKQLSLIELEVLPCSIYLKNRKSITKLIRIEKTNKILERNGDEIIEITPRVLTAAPDSWSITTPFSFERSRVVSDVLEFADVLKWNVIKDMSLGQYYYQQLEMFNFALPADEPADES